MNTTSQMFQLESEQVPAVQLKVLLTRAIMAYFYERSNLRE